MRWLRHWFGSELAALEVEQTRLAARVDRLEQERVERWATMDAAVDKLIRRVRQRNRVEAEEEVNALTNPLTGAPLDPVSARILKLRGGR
jgi:capsid portal protein